jgi:L-ribulose-5-phosphate 4-epimerase
MKEEGVIKFNCNWIKKEALPAEQVKELNNWRNKLYHEKLLGVTADGIGYGNISRRLKQNTFIISGSGTGRLKKLKPLHYSLVTSYSFHENALTAEGPVKASSESLTHAAIYECSPQTQFVFHVHHLYLWKNLLKLLPSTNSSIAYGTTAMAAEIFRLFKEHDLNKQGIFAMGGHEEGVISFGKTAAEAGQIILDKLKEL